MEAKELVLDEEVGDITAVGWYELKTTFDVGEDMLDEDFRDRLWLAVGEHLLEADTTIAIATVPEPSTPAKMFVRHVLRSGLNAAHI